MISSLLTDLYQLTMAYGYWKLGMHEREAVFQLIFRRHPFQGNYAVACGLGTVIEFLRDWRFTPEQVDYLRTLRAGNGERLFPDEFLQYLLTLRFTGDLDALPEGTLTFAHEPLLRVTAPLIQGQLLESTLLNIMNFQTLIATKAARICHVAGKQPVLEFGLRRAQGPDGALSASRAAYIGGCAATSNVLAGQLLGIPVRGTHAHSWVTAFPDELSAFKAYANVMPHNCVLLVDTYDTLQGIRHAIEVGHELRAQGYDLLGVRLDSGDMAALSCQARALLDAAGFHNTAIMASNNLDEQVIANMHEKGSCITVWGVGTHLATAYDYPALDGVYKLSALKNDQGVWEYKLKLSEEAVKISNPGIYQLRRLYKDNKPMMDVLYDTELGLSTSMMTLGSSSQVVDLSAAETSDDLLRPIFSKGSYLYDQPTIESIRSYAIAQVADFLSVYSSGDYPVGLDLHLHHFKMNLIQQTKQRQHHDDK